MFYQKIVNWEMISFYVLLQYMVSLQKNERISAVVLSVTKNAHCQLQKFKNHESDAKKLWGWLKNYKIDNILDSGGEGGLLASEL